MPEERVSVTLPPAWYTETIAPRKGASGFPKYVKNDLSAKLGVMMPESLLSAVVSFRTLIRNRTRCTMSDNLLSVQKASYAEKYRR